MRAFFSNFAGTGATAAQAAETQAAQERDGIFRLNNQNTLSRANRQGNTRAGQRRDPMQERIAAQEREMRIRESENLRIEHLRDEILRVQDSDMEDDVINMTVSMLHEQINNIFMARAEREQIAIERELQRQQQEMDERMRERERAYQNNNVENKTDEELEAAAERSAIRNLTMIGVRMDNINTLSRTRASMSAEAGRLRGEADSEMRLQRAANADIMNFVRDRNRENADSLMGPMEPATLFNDNPLTRPDAFTARHYANLNVGISRLTANINRQVSAMYRDSQNMQEEQLRIYRERSTISERVNEEDDETNTNSIDLRL